MSSRLLKEDGGVLLLETGGALLLEDSTDVVAVPEILFVDVKSDSVTGGSIALTFTEDVLDGDTIVVACSYSGSTPGPAPTDTAGNTYTRVGAATHSASVILLETWIAKNVNGATSPPLTITVAVGTFAAVVAVLLRGAEPDPYNGDWLVATGSTIGPYSVGPTTPDPLDDSLFLAFATVNNPVTLNDASGWNSVDVHGFTGAMLAAAHVDEWSTKFDLFAQYRVASTVQTPTWSNGPAVPWVAMVFSLKPYVPLAITGIAPVTGVPAGGTAVTITGTGFQTDAVLTLNGTPLAAVVTPTTITFHMPAHAVGAVTLTVTNVARGDTPVSTTFTYAIPDVTFALSLAGADARVRVSGLQIHDVLNDSPNTCSLIIDGPAPDVSEVLRIEVGSRLLFAGALQGTEASFQGVTPADAPRPVYPCSAIDDTARFNRLRPFGAWVNISASTVAAELVAAFAPDFSTAGIEAGLPPVSVNLDGSEGMSGAFSQLAQLVGGYWKVEDLVAYLFTEDTSEPPDALDDFNRQLIRDNPKITLRIDTSQQRTRVYGKGKGEALLSDIELDSPPETILPVTNAAVWFGTVAPGGQAISETQVFDYTGVEAGGPGSIAGPGTVPPVAPAVRAQPDGIVEDGDHDYAFTWVTVFGETTPSPITRVRFGTLPSLDAPNVRDGVFYATGVHIPAGTELRYALTLTNPAGTSESPLGTPALYTPTDDDHSVFIETTLTEEMIGRSLRLYRRDNLTVVLDTPPAPTLNVVPFGGSGAETVTYVLVARLNAGNSAAGPPATAASIPTLDGSHYVNVIWSLGAAALTNRSIANGYDVYRTAGGGSTGKIPAVLSYDFSDPNNAQIEFNDTGLLADGSSLPVAAVAGDTDYLLINTTAPVSAGQVGSVALVIDTQYAPALGDPVDHAREFAGVSSEINQADVYIALGPPGTTARKLYRSVANATQLKLHSTIANNTATGPIADNTADASLSTNAPTSDTSLLSTVAGHIDAGSSELLTAGAGTIPTTGGWVLTADQVIRYSGITGNTLTGIPASGPGAIVKPIQYGDHIDVAPALTGVSGLVRRLVKGAPVNIWVRRDDLEAQAEQAAIDLANGVDPPDGIIEGPPIVDERRGEASLTAVLDASLILYARPIKTLIYATRDLKTKSGKSVVVDLASPAISETLTIQDVTITEINTHPGTAPKFTVTASSVRFSLQDMLRRLMRSRGIAQ